MNLRRCSKIIVLTLFAACYVTLAEPSLTIYNKDFAVVREQLNLNLQQGTNKVSITEITGLLEPDSVILRDPTGEQSLQIIEQNYRSDPISQGLLLFLNEGKEIEFITKDKDNIERIVKGKIIRSGYVPQYSNSMTSSQRRYYSSGTQPIIEGDGKLRFSLPGEPVFPALADDTILKPTIYWVLDTDRSGPLDAELSYITAGMGWEADYSILAQNDSDKIDVIGWITVDNQSGRTFENADIKLMAGDVSKIRQNAGYDYSQEWYTPPYGGESPEAVSEKAFEDFHLYNLNRQTTLHDHEIKQVEFLRASDVNNQRVYVYDGAKIDRQYLGHNTESIRNNMDYGTQCNPKVWIFREFKNSTENNLGIPLPKGTMRFYRRNDDGRLEFTGENIIDHTPKDETVRIYTGNAFDLVGERIRTNYIKGSRDTWLDESFEIKVRNRKEKDSVDVRVVEHLYRWMNWEIVGKSDPFTETDSQTIEFRIHLFPGEEKVINYKVRYSW